ncbi:MAG: DUF262 domain-containing protein [Puniceicoccales bacterium]|jgi:hypothetical protein|nr:DUF262 domain-containing protein [Puniceicoccales bacterium]
MNASKQSLADIFNGNRRLEIPFFQRSYVWEEPQWERLLDDMEHVCETRKPYFLGSLIHKQRPTMTSGTTGDARSVVDGQQRLTTLSLFFKALTLLSGENAHFERRFKLVDRTPALLQSEANRVAFNRILDIPPPTTTTGAEASALSPNELLRYARETLRSAAFSSDAAGAAGNVFENNNILRCFLYFLENLRLGADAYDTLVSNVFFVVIDLENDENEQQIFDTINSLGVRLTTAELLRNHLFNRDEIALYKTYWRDVFERDDDAREYWEREVGSGRLKRTAIDLFFHSFLQIRMSDKTAGIAADERRSSRLQETLFESYKSFLDGFKNEPARKEELLASVKEYAMDFRNTFDFDIGNKPLVEPTPLQSINLIVSALDTTTLVPYVLYLVRTVRDTDDAGIRRGILSRTQIKRNKTSKNDIRRILDGKVP